MIFHLTVPVKSHAVSWAPKSSWAQNADGVWFIWQEVNFVEASDVAGAMLKVAAMARWAGAIMPGVPWKVEKQDHS